MKLVVSSYFWKTRGGRVELEALVIGLCDHRLAAIEERVAVLGARFPGEVRPWPLGASGSAHRRREQSLATQPMAAPHTRHAVKAKKNSS